MRVIIDCDPGVDDAVALMLAVKCFEDLGSVEAITVVQGNVDVEEGVLNTAVVLNLCGRTDIPVYPGCTTNILGCDLLRSVQSRYVHGEHGLGDYKHPSQNPADYGVKVVSEKPAAVAIAELVNSAIGEFTLIAVGPLTNVALAMRLDAKLLTKLKHLVIMGGDYAVSNDFELSPEFNFFKDPEAAHIVMSDATPGRCLISVVPFDGCWMSTRNTTYQWFDSILLAEDTPFRRFVAEILVPLRSLKSFPYFNCCDALAILAAFLPQSVIGYEEITSNCKVLLVSSDGSGALVQPFTSGRGYRGCLHVEKSGSGQGGEITTRIITQIDEDIYKKALCDMVTKLSACVPTINANGRC